MVIIEKRSMSVMSMVGVKFELESSRNVLPYQKLHTLTHTNTNWMKRNDDESYITQYRVTTATDSRALTRCMNVNSVASNERQSIFLFQYIVSNL